MPNPHSANPAKPAPSLSIMSRCSTGTALALAAPWISTNCARMYLTLLSFRYFFADWGDITPMLPSMSLLNTLTRLPRYAVHADDTAAQIRGDFRQCFPEIGRKGG